MGRKIVIISFMFVSVSVFLIFATGSAESNIALTMSSILAAQNNNQTIPAKGQKTIYALSSSGYFKTLYNSQLGATWQQAKTAPIATAATDSLFEYIDNLYNDGGGERTVLSRSFLTFDLSSIPDSAIINDVVLHLFSTRITENPTAVQNIVAQKSTHAIPIGINDFHSFSGNAFGIGVPVPADDTDISITFNEEGKKYIQDILGQLAKIIIRDSEYDYGNSDPPLHTHGYMPFITPNVTDVPAERPKLIVSYH